MPGLNPRREPVVEVLHGEPITDPYRWLEDGGRAETRAFEAACNEETRAWLDGPERDAWRSRWLRWAAWPTFTAPRLVGPYLYYLEQPADRAQPLLRREPAAGGAAVTIVDPLDEGADGLSSLDWWVPSPSGRYLAYGVSRHGDEWSTLSVKDLHSGRRLPDQVARSRMSSVAWERDEAGFFYTRHPWPGEAHADDPTYHQHVFHHRLGQDAGQDPDVMGEGRDRRDHFQPQVSPDGRWLVVTVHQGWTRTEVYVAPVTAPTARVLWAGGVDAAFHPLITAAGLYLHTNFGASRWRVLFHAWPTSPAALAPLAPDDWQEVLAEDPSRILLDVAVAKEGLVTHYLEDAASALEWWVDGVRRRVTLPGIGTITHVTAQDGRSGAVFAFESFSDPPGLWGVAAGEAPRRLHGVEEGVGPDMEVRREWYRSTDGTRIPVFVLTARGASPGTPRPTILTGYGGFALPSTPTFRRDAAAWVAEGGVWALAVLRGGSEYGEAWHRAGMREHKQQVFDDCASAARFLIASGVTTTAQLAVWGRSNGGLLAGAMLTQHPELFGAVVIGVPLLDMLRFHRFLIADLWTGEYGSPDDPEAFAYLRRYSPYHQVQDGVPYPPVLLYTARSDSRVDPMHARKMAARLKAASGSDQPVLLRVEDEAGHGVGKPMGRQADEAADILTFVARALKWQP